MGLNLFAGLRLAIEDFVLPIRRVEEGRWRCNGNSNYLWPLLRRTEFLQYAVPWFAPLLRSFVFLCEREGVQQPTGLQIRGVLLYPGVQFV